MGTLLGKLVATPSKRLLTWLSVLLIFLLSYIFRSFFTPLVY
jgi:hypothetical protein